MFQNIISKANYFRFEFKKGTLGRNFSGILSRRFNLSRRVSNEISSIFKKVFLFKKFIIRKYFVKFQSIDKEIDNRKKYLLTETNELKNVDSLLKHCLKVAKKKKIKFKPDSNKFTFNLIEYDKDDESISLRNINEIRPIFEFFTQEKILKVVINYLKEVPVVGNVCLFYSYPHNGSFGSEKFHLDQQSHKQVHVVFPINDVNSFNGPFSFLSAIKTNNVLSNRKYLGGRIEDDEVYKFAKKEELIQFKSPKGKKILFVDPYHCLHYGARAKSKPRILIVFNYTSRFEGSETANGLYRMKNRKLLERKDNKFDRYLLDL